MLTLDNRFQQVFSKRKGRLAFLSIAILFVLIIFLGWLFYLQIIRYDYFQRVADNNRIYKRIIAPKRGNIFDSKGVLLAGNRPVSDLIIDIKKVQDIHKTLEKLGEIITLTESEKANFLERLEADNVGRFLVLKNNVSDQDEARFVVKQIYFDEAELVTEGIKRIYPKNDHLTHVLGYVGSIDKRDLKRLDKINYQGIYSTGKTGLEYIYESLLHGKIGHAPMEVDVRGHFVREIKTLAAQNGQNLELFLDYELQAYIISLLEGKEASVVVVEVETGGVLAAVSMPSFDPNFFVSGISQKDFDIIRQSPLLPMFNRFSSGLYPPASLIKPFIALEALHQGKDPDKQTFDKGWFKIGQDNRIYRNWKRKGHGLTDMRRAMRVSNDTYFYQLGDEYGIDFLVDSLTNFDFGQKVGVDLFNEKKGNVPSPDWKLKALGQSWLPGDTINVSIGQGYTLATPIQLVYAYNVIANRGKKIPIRLVKSIEGVPTSFRESAPLEFESAHWDYVTQSLVDVMHQREGTGFYSRWRAGIKKPSYKIAGKTGTSQVIGLSQENNKKIKIEDIEHQFRDHSLFAGFAPAREPKIAVVVVVEHGGGGGRTATPLAWKIIDFYLHKEDLVK